MADFDEKIAQLEQFVKALPDRLLTKEKLKEVLELDAVRRIPPHFFPASFPELLAKRFKVDVSVVKPYFALKRQVVQPPNFDALLPQSGWFERYMHYTSGTEPPSPFHFFSAAVIVGAVLQRRIYYPRGSGDLFPNLSAILVAPPGIAKKTTAGNLAVSLFKRLGGNILADKLTPEALVEAFRALTSATGLIYAPEWAVMMGKQQYLEGLVPMLTALFDCPEEWSSATIVRGQTTLHKVALSHLGCTTLDWMQTSVTKDALSGGFMSRLLFVVQNETDRCFPRPVPLNTKLGKRLVDELVALQRLGGAIAMSVDATAWFDKWYEDRRKVERSSEKYFAGYYERKPDRLLQLAMILHVAEGKKDLTLQLKTLRKAEELLNWLELLLPQVFDELSSTLVGDIQISMMKQLRSKGGKLKHSKWLLMNTSRMNADTFRKCVETLQQADMVSYDETTRTYYSL